MRAIAFVLAAVVSMTSIAHAQPGGPPPADPAPADPSPYPPAPYPDPLPPQPMPPPQQPPPYGYQPVAVQVTPDEHALLQRGEITDMAHLGGGMANVFFGFGIGHAIQGRWSEKGWLFTLGGAASIAAIVVGITQSFEGGDDVPALFIAGYLSFLVFHIWGAVDAFVEPPKHNRRVRELKMRLGMPTYFGQRVMPYLMKSNEGGGGTAGLVFRF